MTTIVWFHRVTEYDCIQMQKDTEYENELLDTFPQLVIFDDANDCIDYISNCSSKSVDVILSDIQGIQVFSLIYQLEQLTFVYILDTLSTDEYLKCKVFIQNCWLIRGLFKTVKKLLEQMEYDLLSRKKTNTIITDPFDLLVGQLNTIDDLDKHPNERLRFQIIFDSLLHSHHSIDDCSSKVIRERMIEECRRQYATDQRELKKIDEFESNETKWTTIQWWSQDSFIYRLINSALRSRHWNSIIKYQYFIVKLYHELHKLHEEQCISGEKSRFVVYRGQSMFIEDLNIFKNNLGGIVSMNYFLSTTLDKDVALMFSEGEEGKTIGVIFYIQLDSTISSAVFADISVLSTINDEAEILLSPGMVFRIESVVDDHTKDKWIVHLNLIDPNEDRLLSFLLTNSIEKNLGQVLYEMGEYETARDFCQLMVTNKIDPISYHSILGNVFKELGEYDCALENHFRALQCVTSIYQCSSIYYNIGLAYLGKNDYLRAIRYYHEASQLECVEGETMNLAEIYHDMGLAYIGKGSLRTGLNYLKRAFQIQKLILPENHSHLGITYLNLGDVYRDENQIDQALDHYQQALDIFRCSRRIDDHLIIAAHIRIAQLYLKSKQGDMARKTFECLAEIYGNTNNHLKLTNIYLDVIFSILFPRQDFLQCINFLEYILSIHRKYLSANHRLIGVTLYVLGSFQLFQYQSTSQDKSSDLLKLSCTNLQQSKEISRQYTKYMALICENLGLVYHALQQYSQSIEYLKLSLKYSSENDQRIALRQRNLACVYASNGQYQYAIQY